MQEAHHPYEMDAGHHAEIAHHETAFGEITPYDLGYGLDDHYYRDASVQSHLARAMDFKTAPL